MKAKPVAGPGKPVTGKGKPLPLGATVTNDGVNFAIVSTSATAMTLLLFEKGEAEPFANINMDPQTNRTGDVWHMSVGGLNHKAVTYAYKADGPWNPEHGERLDPDAILLDPYARSICGAHDWGGRYIRVDKTAGKVKTISKLTCAIESEPFDWRGDKRPAIPLEEMIIYELHTRGFTRHPSSGVRHPGVFKGLIEKLPYLKNLGVNAIELMPIHEFFESEIVRANPLTGARLLNYWGYSTAAFFAPKASYASSGKTGGQIQEFRELVLRCHEMGIEVILDVVFNHTAEGNANGPTLSFRGLDNKTYYMLGQGGDYLNFSGCGNTMNCNHPVTREMIRDCLRYWVMETHVDGFRFDMASIFARAANGAPMGNPPLVEMITKDPLLANCKLIAEAWDAGGLYQVGSFPAGGRWLEWNGKYRDTARRFLKGDGGQVSKLATRIAGSPDLYEDDGRRPGHSVNFITCHDGFTLKDLFSYNKKHNSANGEDNRDGTNSNWSENMGVEGPSDDPAIRSARLTQMKNAIVLLMLSQGVPMIYEGDEMARTKHGNNNTYCHDTDLNWINWGDLKKNAGFHRFVRGMIHLRKRHPALGRAMFYTGEPLPGTDVPDIAWHGRKAGEPDWSDSARSIAFVIGGPVTQGGARAPDIYTAFNSEPGSVVFELPPATGGAWRQVVCTALESPDDFCEPGQEKELENQSSIELASKSCVALVSWKNF